MKIVIVRTTRGLAVAPDWMADAFRKVYGEPIPVDEWPEVPDEDRQDAVDPERR